MPYIKQLDRVALDAKGDSPKNAGELNYAFTKIVIKYLEQNGLNYQHINDVIGALEGAKFEAYRRIAAGYEDKKVQENGEIYPKTLIGNR